MLDTERWSTEGGSYTYTLKNTDAYACIVGKHGQHVNTLYRMYDHVLHHNFGFVELHLPAVSDGGHCSAPMRRIAEQCSPERPISCHSPPSPATGAPLKTRVPR